MFVVLQLAMAVCAMCVCSNISPLSDSDEGYWVGKTSLRSWRQLALEQLDEDEEETKHIDGKSNGEGPAITATKGTQTSRGQSTTWKTTCHNDM